MQLDNNRTQCNVRDSSLGKVLALYWVWHELDLQNSYNKSWTWWHALKMLKLGRHRQISEAHLKDHLASLVSSRPIETLF